jgi:aromatic ring-opening dioxygenase catalytic subunit (LigB family)
LVLDADIDQFSKLTKSPGALPLMNDPMHKSITHSLKNRVPSLLSLSSAPPKAIVLLTAHWSTATPTISSAEKHSLVFDYSNFPPEAYQYKYPASGAPEIATQIHKTMTDLGLEPKLDPERGWDHGVFVPLLLIAPDASIPIIQLSVLSSEDPTKHFLLGQALLQLREQNIAVIGSGFASLHNLGMMMELMSSPPTPGSPFRTRSDEWNNALKEAVTTKDRNERLEKLKKWREFPHSFEMHPRGGGEHFMPLLACAGAAGDEEGKWFVDPFCGVDIYTYYWGAELKEGK